MNIAVDMDSTLLDVESVWIELFNSYAEEHQHKEIVREITRWTYLDEVCPLCWEQCLTDDVALRADLFPGAKETLRFLFSLARLHLVSHRNPSFRQTGLKIMSNRGILPLFDTFTWSHEPKEETCWSLKCGAIIDDSPAVLESFVGSRVMPIKFLRSYNRDAPGIEVRNWKEIEELFKGPLSDMWLADLLVRQSGVA